MIKKDWEPIQSFGETNSKSKVFFGTAYKLGETNYDSSSRPSLESGKNHRIRSGSCDSLK